MLSNKPAKANAFFASFVSIFLGLLMIAVAVYGGVSTREDEEFQLACRSWPTTTGKIDSSSLNCGKKNKLADAYISYSPSIWYSYRVNGKNYSNNRVTLTGSENMLLQDKAKQAAFVDKYNAGKIVNVFYNPKAPGRSCLETVSDGLCPSHSFGMCMAIGILGTVLSMYGLFILRSSLSKN